MTRAMEENQLALLLRGPKAPDRRFRVWGLGFRVWGLGFRVPGSGGWGPGSGVWGLGSWGKVGVEGATASRF